MPTADPLPPLGKWVVAHEERMCTLSRTFSTASGAITFVLRPYLVTGNGEEQIVLLLPPNADQRTRRGKGRIRLQPIERSFVMAYASGPMDETGRRGLNMDVDNASIRGALAESSILSIQADASYSFQVKGIAGALRALKTCEEGLLRSWGADPAAMVAPPPLLARWFGVDAYPAGALRAGASGQVNTVIKVDPRGRVVECRVVAGSGNAELDDQTCRIVRQRGRYEPVAKGVETNRWSVFSVRWTLN